MSWPRREAYSYGLLEGESTFENNKNDLQLAKYYEKDRLGEYVEEILYNYR